MYSKAPLTPRLDTRSLVEMLLYISLDSALPDIFTLIIFDSGAFDIATGIRSLGLGRLELRAADQNDIFELLAVSYALGTNLINALEGIMTSAHSPHLPTGFLADTFSFPGPDVSFGFHLPGETSA